MNDSEKLYLNTSNPLYIAVGIATIYSFPALTQIANPKANCDSEIKLIYEQVLEQHPPYSPSIVKPQQDIIYFKELISFAENLVKSQISLDTESQKILNDNFWDLI
jgi:hypothetical protein